VDLHAAVPRKGGGRRLRCPARDGRRRDRRSFHGGRIARVKREERVGTRRVAHLIDPYLSSPALDSHAAGSERGIRHIVLCSGTENLDLFPHSPVMAAAEASGRRKALERVRADLAARRWSRTAGGEGSGAVLLHAHFGLGGLPRSAAPARDAAAAGDDVLRTRCLAGSAPPALAGPATGRSFATASASSSKGSQWPPGSLKRAAAERGFRVTPLGIDLDRVPFGSEGSRRARHAHPLLGSFREKKGAPDGGCRRSPGAAALSERELVMLGDGPERELVEAAVARGVRGLGRPSRLRGLHGIRGGTPARAPSDRTEPDAKRRRHGRGGPGHGDRSAGRRPSGHQHDAL